MKTPYRIIAQFIIWGILILLACWEPARGQEIKMTNYTSWYNTKTLIPDSVRWTVTKDEIAHATPRLKNPFNGNPNLRNDYLNSGFDEGHNSPAEDNSFNSKVEYECFNDINMFPQRPALNRVTWLALENYTRQMATKYDSVLVKTSWAGSLSLIGKKHKILVPKYTIKEIWYDSKYEKYIMPNQDSVKKHGFKYYQIK